jgi:DNA-binding CsgD family transcriptional regulator
MQRTPSARQIQMIRLLCEGRTLGQVGAHMGCSHNTVNEYLRRVYKKLGIRRERCSARVQLFKWALKNKVVNL